MTSPIKTVVELRRKPKLDFYRRLDDYIENLESDFPEWETDKLRTTMWNDSTHRLIQISNTAIRIDAVFIADRSAKDYDFFTKTLDDLVDKCRRYIKED